MIDAGTVADGLGSLRAVVGFSLVLVMPGYFFGSMSNVADWRRLGAGERLLWSVGLSLAVVPLVAVYLLKYLHWAGLFAGLAVCAGGALWRGSRDETFSGSRARPGRGGWVALAWVVFAIAELVDVGTGRHLYLSVTIFDHALRTAFVDAVMRTGAPPANPLFWPGHAVAMRYYYFWYVLCAAVAKAVGASARQALIASVVWAGFALAAVVGLYCRWFLPEPPRGRAGRSRTLLGVVLLGVAGLDILPAVAKLLARLPADPEMDWWAADQVTTWAGSLLWVPHHVAAMVCCTVGFLLVWVSHTGHHRLRYGVLAGLAFASAFGLSTWVAMAFAMVFAAWAPWAWWREPRMRGRVRTLLGAGLVASVLLLPYLQELRSEPSGVVTIAGGGADAQASAGRLMRFGVRRMIDSEWMRSVPGVAQLARRHPRLEEASAGLLLLVPGYFAELGFWGAVLWVISRSRRLGEAERTARMLVVAGLIVTTFLRSTIVTNNDFGMRSALVMQFFLLLFGIRWVEGGLGSRGVGFRRFAWALLWIGIAGTAYQAVLLRIYLPVEEHAGNADVVGLSERAAALRSALREADGRMGSDAVVQFAMKQPSDYFRYAQILLVDRQIASALPVCTVGFGGDARDCVALESRAAALFAVSREAGVGGGGGVLSAGEAGALCAQMGMTTLVATRWDGVWLDPRGWVWNLPKVVATDDVRVVRCER